MSKLLDELQSGRVLLMDGAMGSELYQAGLNPGECGEAWNLDRPERVRAIHKSYAAAGARCLLTNTFQSNPAALVRHDREDEVYELSEAAVKLARAGAGQNGFVLADVGPIVMHGTDEEFSDRDDLTRTVEPFLSATAQRYGVDGILLETCSSPRALSAVEYLRHRILEHEEMPVLLSLTYLKRADGELVTLSGHRPETFARHAARHGVAALGVNCGRDVGLDDVLAIVRRYREVTDLPLFARPNAGTPEVRDGQLIYALSPEEMGGWLPELFDAGAVMVGGCCGTTPAHIAAMRPVVERWNARALSV